MNEFIKSVLFVSAITLVGIVSLMGTATDNLNLSRTEMLQGKAAETLEARFETALPLRELGINFWALLRYVIFNAGEPGVVIGESGWLFSSEEFFAPEFAQDNIISNFMTISTVNEELAKQGVQNGCVDKRVLRCLLRHWRILHNHEVCVWVVCCST